MSDDDLGSPIPVRFSEETVDAVEEIAHEHRTNRSEVIREMVRDAVQSDEWELREDAAILAGYEREKQFAKVTMLREGFLQNARYFLNGVAWAKPPWDGEMAQSMFDRYARQAGELWPDDEETRAEKLAQVQREIDRYRYAYEVMVEDRDPDAVAAEIDAVDPGEEVSYVGTFRAALGDDEDGEEWRPEWKDDPEDLAAETIPHLLATHPDVNTPEDTIDVLRKRKGADGEVARAAVDHYRSNGHGEHAEADVEDDDQDDVDGEEDPAPESPEDLARDVIPTLLNHGWESPEDTIPDLADREGVTEEMAREAVDVYRRQQDAREVPADD